MNTQSTFASALPSERDKRIIRRKAAALRAAHLRSLVRRLGAAVTGLGAFVQGSEGARRA